MDQGHKEAKITARQLLPLLALEYGYHLYIVETTKAADSVLRRSAVLSVAAIEKILTGFGENNSAALYGLYFRAGATSLAKGIIRRKRELLKQGTDASKRLEDHLSQFALQERLSGLAKAGWQLLVLAGIVSFVFFAIKAILTLPMVQIEVSNEHQLFAAVATALGTGLIWPSIRAFFYRRAHQRVFDDYRNAMRQASIEYQQRIGGEYRLAIRTVETGWEQLTGEKLPHSQSDALQSLVTVMGITDDDQDRLRPVSLEDLDDSTSPVLKPT